LTALKNVRPGAVMLADTYTPRLDSYIKRPNRAAMGAAKLTEDPPCAPKLRSWSNRSTNP
jgi:hypothetical protein